MEEWQYALSQCKGVTTLLFQGAYDDLPDDLKHYHAPDFTQASQYDDTLKELLRQLREPLSPLGDVNAPNLLAHQIKRPQVLAAVKQPVLRHLREPLQDLVYRICLHGMGGLGKSQLSLALAHDCEVRRAFPDGVIWLAIGPEPNLAQRQRDAALALHDNIQNYSDDIESNKTLLRRLFNGKACLLILDDIWDYQHVNAFDVIDRQARLLVTTRFSAFVQRLSAASVAMPALDSDEGLAIFRKRLGVAEDADLNDESMLTQIIALLGYHTLAIDIAAAWLAERLPNDAAAQSKLLQRIQAGASGTVLGEMPQNIDGDKVTDKNANVWRSLALSYDWLKPQQQERFRALGVLSVGAPVDAEIAAALWQTDTQDAEDELHHLGQVALLSAQGDGLYTQHQLVYAIARHLLEADAGAHKALKGRLIAFAVPYAEQNRVNTPQMQRHEANFEQTLECAIQRDDLPAAARLVRAYGYHLALSSRWQQSMALSDRVIPLLEAAERYEWLPTVLLNKLIIDANLTRSDQTFETVDRILEIADEVEPHFPEIDFNMQRFSAIYMRGAYQHRKGNMQAAIADFETATEIAKRIREQQDLYLARAAFNLGALYLEIGQTQKAIEYTETAVAGAERTNNIFLQGQGLLNLGVILLNKLELEKAEASQIEGRELAEANDIKQILFLALTNLGIIAFERGD